MNDDKWGQLTEYGKDKYIALLEKQVEEKDAIIDWLAERVEGFCSHTPCSLCIYENDRYDECPVSKIGWRKTAQEEVKKHE